MANAQVTLSLPVLRKGLEPETGPTAVKHLQLMLKSAGRLSDPGRGWRLWRNHRRVGQALSAEREPHGGRDRRATDMDFPPIQVALAVGTRLTLVVRSLQLATLIAATLSGFAGQHVFADSTGPANLQAQNDSTEVCKPEDIAVYMSEPSFAIASSCSQTEKEAAETAQSRAYLIATATPGYTMMRQGPERAIARLHPAFVNRLAAAIAEARETGLPFAGIFSAYRPPAFGVGGFVDKFHSLHTYGLAVDMAGIGTPGTPAALLWHEIAARHGVICPYGPHNPAEWNHCQPTWVKVILAESPLRETVTAEGPISLEGMFEIGYSLIATPGSPSRPMADPSAHFFKQRQPRTASPVKRQSTAADTNTRPKPTTSWAVSLVGDRSKTNVLAAYHRLWKKYETILGAYQPVVVDTSLGVNSAAVWHRLRIEANSRAVVQSLCSRLRAAGGSCLIQRI